MDQQEHVLLQGRGCEGSRQAQGQSYCLTSSSKCPLSGKLDTDTPDLLFLTLHGTGVSLTVDHPETVFIDIVLHGLLQAVTEAGEDMGIPRRG